MPRRDSLPKKRVSRCALLSLSLCGAPPALRPSRLHGCGVTAHSILSFRALAANDTHACHAQCCSNHGRCINSGVCECDVDYGPVVVSGIKSMCPDWYCDPNQYITLNQPWYPSIVPSSFMVMRAWRVWSPFWGLLKSATTRPFFAVAAVGPACTQDVFAQSWPPSLDASAHTPFVWVRAWDWMFWVPSSS
jgi:hypothetical protein